MGLTTKACSKCKEEKALTEFNKRKATSDGLQGMCKVCSKNVYKLWAKNNPERAREKFRNWQKNNREKMKEREKLHRETLSNSYVINQLRLTKGQAATPELIELKRTQIIISRAMKEIKNVGNNKA